jgi:DedD protein
MDQQLKQRLVGAAVLVALGVIFIPVFLDRSALEETGVESHASPQLPEEEFSSQVVPLDEDDMTALEKAVTALPQEPIATPDGGEPSEREEVADPSAEETEQEISQTKPRTGVTAWVVQVGSFNSVANAEALEARLKADGYKAFVEPLRDGAGTSYRVRIGPELSRSKADELREKLGKQIETRAIVMRYP